jgi:hypothetical protein
MLVNLSRVAIYYLLTSYCGAETGVDENPTPAAQIYSQLSKVWKAKKIR